MAKMTLERMSRIADMVSANNRYRYATAGLIQGHPTLRLRYHYRAEPRDMDIYPKGESVDGIQSYYIYAIGPGNGILGHVVLPQPEDITDQAFAKWAEECVNGLEGSGKFPV